MLTFFMSLLTLFVTYVSWFYLVKTRRKSNEAKGPLPLPIVGNLHQIVSEDKIAFKALHRMSLKYGPVFTVWFGRRKQVVVSGVEELKEMMHNPQFDDRVWPPKKQIIDEIYSGQTVEENPHNLGVLFASGDNWKTLRRSTLKFLRDHGFGKQTAETFILHEAQYCVDYLREKVASNPIVSNIDEVFTMMALNVVWQMAAGERFNYHEEGMKRLLQSMQSINEIFWSVLFSPLTPLPFLRHFPPMKAVLEKAQRKMNSLRNFYKETLVKHKETFDPDNIRDVIDAFLLEIENGDKTYFDENQLSVVLSDLFLAGSETTGKSMEWACLFMILHPEVQSKVQNELDQVVGNGEVTAPHRPQLPYTEATLHEIWRCGPVGPIAATRCPREDTKVGQFVISAGTVVFPNLFSMTQDAKLWGPDVKEFKPERFISFDDENKRFQNEWWNFTFGTGRRKCLGESVARVETFLFFANLLKNFKLEIPEGQDPPTTEPVDGMTIGPKHFEIKFTPR